VKFFWKYLWKMCIKQEVFSNSICNQNNQIIQWQKCICDSKSMFRQNFIFKSWDYQTGGRGGGQVTFLMEVIMHRDLLIVIRLRDFSGTEKMLITSFQQTWAMDIPKPVLNWLKLCFMYIKNLFQCRLRQEIICMKVGSLWLQFVHEVGITKHLLEISEGSG
jgi:hypothetical protein